MSDVDIGIFEYFLHDMLKYGFDLDRVDASMLCILSQCRVVQVQTAHYIRLLHVRCVLCHESSNLCGHLDRVKIWRVVIKNDQIVDASPLDQVLLDHRYSFFAGHCKFTASLELLQ